MKKSILEELVDLNENRILEYCHSVSLKGEIAQVIQFELKTGQNMWASKGSLISYGEHIQWELKIPGGAGKAVGRMLSGEGVSLTYVTAYKRSTISIAANQPGKLATWDLKNGPIVCTPGSFLAGIGKVNIDVTVARSAGAALFGGAGLFLQKLSGTGVVVINCAGDFVEHSLAAGEKLLVSTGNLAVFSDSVSYDIRTVGGCFKMFFGGEGVFMTEMKGPGWVMLQTLKKTPTSTKPGR